MAWNKLDVLPPGAFQDPIDRVLFDFEIDRQMAEASAPTPEPQSVPKPQPSQARSFNELRPVTFDDIIGQAEAKEMLAQMVKTAKARHRPLSHVLLVGPAGTGKTTFANVIAHEMGASVFQLEAPISMDTLVQLQSTMSDGDILFVDEIHQQAIMERRGRSSSTQPEVLFSVMEDFTLPTEFGVLPFPRITVMGATTDEGMLPDPFIMRFPVKPQLESYGEDDLTRIALKNADALGGAITRSAARIFAKAARGTPREINNFVRNAMDLSETGVIRDKLATKILRYNRVTDDGLTRDMQAMLVYMYRFCRRESKDGEVKYQASINSIATGIGKSRDTKAIQLRVEPWLIQCGYIQVLHGGRALTDTGLLRAMGLNRKAA